MYYLHWFTRVFTYFLLLTSSYFTVAYIDTFQIFSEQQKADLRIGGRILRDCLTFIEGMVKPGISTLDIDLVAEKFIRDRGGVPAFKGYHDFPGTLCTSVNDAVVHGIPSKKQILKDGDIISCDCGVIYGGLYTDACTSVGVGSIPQEVQDFLDCTSQTLERVVARFGRPGSRIGDISSFIEQSLKDKGYHAVRALTGHGLGDSLHQYPDVPNVGKAGTGPTLPVGTMIAIEPIAVMGSPDVYTENDGWTVRTKDGSRACHFEHSILMTETGCEVIA